VCKAAHLHVRALKKMNKTFNHARTRRRVALMCIATACGISLCMCVSPGLKHTPTFVELYMAKAKVSAAIDV